MTYLKISWKILSVMNAASRLFPGAQPARMLGIAPATVSFASGKLISLCVTFSNVMHRVLTKMKKRTPHPKIRKQN